MDEHKAGSIKTNQAHDCCEGEELVSCTESKLESDGLGADIGTFCLGEEIAHNCVESEHQSTIESAQSDPNYVHVEQAIDAEQRAIFAEAEEDLHTDVEFGENVELGQDLPPTTSGSDAVAEDAVNGEHCISFLDNFDGPSTSAKQVASVQQRRRYPCEECGESFVKPSNLKQHMLCHATEKVFCCPISGCGSKYKRPDHLKRHMVTHSGQLFFCTWEGCNASFTLVSNLKRHTKLHQVKGDYLQRCGKRAKLEDLKSYICAQPNCGQDFQFESQLRRHESTTHGNKCTLYQCSDPGCGESFSDYKALLHHVRTLHGFFVCEVCGLSIPTRKESKHRRGHDEAYEKLSCPVTGCQYSSTKRSNLISHVKAVHEEVKPFLCSVAGCGRSFAYKAVRDRHEKTGGHCPTTGDFELEEERFRSRPRGGRRPATIESLRDLFGTEDC